MSEIKGVCEHCGTAGRVSLVARERATVEITRGIRVTPVVLLCATCAAREETR